MAKGLSGKTYEAFTYVVLEKILHEGGLSGRLFWNETPAAISVEPDFLIGTNKDSPAYVFAVSHGDSPKESNRKCWRNISELCEMKTKLPISPKVINIIFDSHIKEDIKKLEDGAFDGQVIIGDTEWGNYLKSWVSENMSGMPADNEEKAAYVRTAIAKNRKLATCFEFVLREVQTVISSSTDIQMEALWEFERRRIRKAYKTTHMTHLKRGMAKRLLVGNAIADPITPSDGKWMTELGITRKSITGYSIVDQELLWFLDSPFSTNYQTIASRCMTPGFRNQLIKVKNFALINVFAEYLLSNYATLTTKDGMLSCMLAQWSDPTSDISIPPEIEAPTHVWIYDIASTFIKAAERKSQGFGYSFFATHPLSGAAHIGATKVGDWCARFAGEFFNRKPKFQTPKIAIELMATVLSEKLAEYPLSTLTSIRDALTEQYIAKEYEKTYLSHRGFLPLQQLIIDNIPTKVESRNIRTCFAEKENLGGQSGEISVLFANNTIIRCLSTNKNPRDKRKELCGQSIGLRYEWNRTLKEFKPRTGVKKLILFIDGRWNQDDLNALIDAGWDEIYYPDEIDELKRAIV